MIEIILKDLPKHSLNEIYAGKHWIKRKQDKDRYTLLIKSQCKRVFKKDKIYKVSYEFNFKKNALDVSNTVYMLKMIEDVLFEDDAYKIIPELTIRSQKGKEDNVIIKITEL
jgi:hypothetical protein